MRKQGSLMIEAASLLLCWICLIQLQTASAAPTSAPSDERQYWLERKEAFYERTRFALPEESLKVLGFKRLLFVSDTLIPSGHLPFWFDYELFKRVFNKPQVAPTQHEEVQRHNAYLKQCVRVLKQRTLYRMLAATVDARITPDADKYYWEKLGQTKEGSGSGNNTQSISDNNNNNNNSNDDERNDNLSASIEFMARLEPAGGGDNEEDGAPELQEEPLERALRLVRQELDRVESKNQAEHYLRAFNEVDGSAIDGRLPY